MKNSQYALGVDLGGTNLKMALLDGEERIVARWSSPTSGVEGHDAILARMIGGIRELQTAAQGTVVGVGVGVPGMVDMAAGVTGDLPNLPGRWTGVPVAATLGDAVGLPVAVVNDGKTFALAEHRLGAARGSANALFVTVGTGIGGAIVADGRLIFGLGGASGEVGHLIVQPEGPRCTCGNFGCVETLASGPAIAAEAIRRVVQGFSTELATRCEGNLNAITPEFVALVAEAGDPAAIEILDRAGAWLGIALAGAIALVAPDVVVIGGGVAPAGSRYLRAAERTARAHSGVTEIDRIAFRTAALGYDAGVIGAALWGRESAQAGSQ